MKTKINISMRAVLFSILIAGAVLGFCQPACAVEQPPERMTYQGFLVDGDGVALGNVSPENYEVLFRIYSASAGGILKWSEQQTVTVDKGYFSVLLGEGTVVNGELKPALSSVFTGTDADERFIGISVKGIGPGGSDADILPRLRLVTAPYAYLASQVAPDAISGANIQNSSIQSVDIQDNSISGSDILNESITGSDILNESITGSDILNESISGSDIQNNSISGADILNESITYYDLAPNSVYASEIAANAVGSSEIAANAVGSSEIADNAVGASEIAANAVGSSELQSNLRIDGLGINASVPDWCSLFMVDRASSTYPILIRDASNNDIFRINKDGLLNLYRVSTTSPAHLPLLYLQGNTPNTGYFNWSLGADTDDAGGADIDLFFYHNGVSKGWVDAAGGFVSSSDERLKQDIEDMGSVLDRALQLQPRLYRFKDNPDGDLQVGFIAQEVQPYFPEIVDSAEEYMGLFYDRLGVIAIGAIKELNEKVETLESEKSALLQRLDALEARVQSLEQ